MPANENSEKSQALSDDTQQVVAAFEGLGTDEKLALLYFIYKEMGKSITQAAPAATNSQLAPKLLGDYLQLSNEQQLAIMREIVNREHTEYSHAYGVLKENNQLMVWFAWAQAMGNTVVDMPSGYEQSEASNDVFNRIKALDFEGQISLLRTIASNMGYTDIKAIPTQAETGKTSSL